MLGRQPGHGDRQDVARAALGLRAGLGLDLLQAHAGLVLCLLLDLGDEHLLGLRGAEAGEPLQLAALDPLCLLELLGLLGEVALAVAERLRAPVDVGALDGKRLGLAQGALLHPRDLLAAGSELVGDGAVRGRGRGGRTRPLLRPAGTLPSPR